MSESKTDPVPEALGPEALGPETRAPDGFIERLKQEGGESLPSSLDGIAAGRVPAARLLDLMQALKTGPGLVFDMLIDVCSVDEWKKSPRFDVIYHLRATATGEMVRIKVFCEGEPPTVPSVVSIYGTADWHEREAYDMMGIHFSGHPDLKRILMPLEYEHHPLRKDFPREGIVPEKLYRRLYPDD